MRKLIAGNWKMNGTRADAAGFAAALKERLATAPRADLLVCPPAPLVGDLARALAGTPVAIGGQDCHAEAKGAHTGDVSAALLADLGCRFVIAGHSERRTDHGETNAMVAAKAAAAWAAGLIAVVCLGETGEQRAAGRTLDVVASQLAGSLPPGCTPENTVIAYEPVWAIGSGATPTSREIEAVHGHLRQRLGARLGDAAGRLRLLYGGSVKPSNAAEILAVANVDGALVGGASLAAADFWAIQAACP